MGRRRRVKLEAIDDDDADEEAIMVEGKVEWCCCSVRAWRVMVLLCIDNKNKGEQREWLKVELHG